jgi:hypothetical protein
MTKLSISQAWDDSRAILARDGKLITTVALALFVLPGIILNLVMPGTRSGTLAQMAPFIVVGLVVLLISLTGQLAIIRLALGPHITVRDAIVHGARRVFPYVGGVLIWFAPIMIANYFLVTQMKADPAHPSVPAALLVILVSVIGIIVVVRLMLLSAVASAEHGNPVRLIRRTWELTHGNWWRLFGFLIIFGAGALALIWAADSVIGVVARLAFGTVDSFSVGGLIVIIVSQLVSAAVSLLLFVMIARLYAQASARGSAQASVPISGI